MFPSSLRILVFSLALPSLLYARTLPDLHDHFHQPSPTISKRLPASNWYHDRDHPVHRLFARQSDNSSGEYPSVGSPAWQAPYPTSTPDTTQLPQAWVDALNDAVNAGKIPNIPQSSNSDGSNPTYPSGYDPTSPTVCSATYKCRNPDDIWDAPDGVIGSGFDDGPTQYSPTLYTFLQQNKIKATHFMIGVNILWNPTAFVQAYDTNGDDIAVHTWTHPYMTTLSNLDVLAQLGWTMQIIHNSTAGKVPKFWRPPYGDSDERVRAIALEVFGLTTIIWNQDTEDWSLTSGGTTPQAINASMTTWLTGSKSPGLIILEHELSDESVAAYIAAYPVMIQNGWNLVSVSEIQGGEAFRQGDVLDLYDTTSSSSVASSTASSSSSSKASSTASKSGANGSSASTGASQKTSGAPRTVPQSCGLGVVMILGALCVCGGLA